MAANNSWTRMSPYFLSLLRIVAALLFIQHGADKLFNLPGGPFTLMASAKLFSIVPGLAGILEFFGGLLLLVGLFSRPIAFILSGMMACAYFMAHFPVNHVYPILNGGDLAVLFCFTFLYLSAAGPGPWSLDRMLNRA